MTFYLIGIDHKVAPIGIREAVYWKRPHIAEYSTKRIAGRTAVLSTCNRFEIYGIAENETQAKLATGLFKSRFDPVFNNSYTTCGTKNVFRHLVSLAAGLESQIKGELEIFSQLGAWALSDNFPEELAILVRDALLSGHEIRMRSGFSRPENNIAASLYSRMLGSHNSDDLLNVVVAGTGKVAGLFASYKPHGVRLYFAAHKNILKAEVLAKIAGGKALPLKELPHLLLSADVFISATSSPHRIFNKKYFSKIAASRDKELYVYDLSIPRDVSPDVSGISGIILKNIDEVFTDADIKNRNSAQPVSY